MNLDNLYQSEQNNNTAQLKELYYQNKDVISFYKAIDNQLQELIKDATDAKAINFTVNALKSNINTLTRIKFMVFDGEDEITEDLQKKWKKQVKYITKHMGINEAVSFLNILLEFEEKVEKKLKKERKNQKEIEALYLRIVDANWDKLINFKTLVKEIQITRTSKNIEHQKKFLQDLEKKLEETQLFLYYEESKLFLEHLKKINIKSEFEKSEEAKLHTQRSIISLKEFINVLENISLIELWLKRKNDAPQISGPFIFSLLSNKLSEFYSFPYKLHLNRYYTNDERLKYIIQNHLYLKD